MKRTLALGAVLLLVAVAGAAAWMWSSIEQPYQGFAAEGVFVDLPHGASSRTVARLLKKNGVIRSALAFEVYARRHPRRQLQAGEYFFNHEISGHDVFWQIAYSLPRHPTPTDVTAEMVRKFKEEWQRIAPPESKGDTSGLEHGRPVASVVTLASLVERETPKPEERPLVAGAFENRLRKNIPLQCDPTVIYAMQDAGQYNGRITGADLHFPSPYNTYAHAGLPPGPIGNPGEASLRAALDPAKTDYLYFVANTQGGHFFAATLVEHNRNVTKYRRLLAGLPADPPTPPPALPAAHKQITKAPRKHAAPAKKSQGKRKAHPNQQHVAAQ